jgi:hypothetical protein
MLLHTRSLVGSVIDTRESSFWKRQWVYNDNVNSPEIKAWLGFAVGKEAEDLSRHDKYIEMKEAAN